MLKEKLREHQYICDPEVAVGIYLAVRMKKPLLLTGEPGVGKTEVAKVLAKIFDTELIRLQCYEGLDENKALYEWNYQRQLLDIQKSAATGELPEDLFDDQYLLTRPLLKAILADKPPVLLIDEIDKTDEEFEAFLFEILSDFQVSIPERGTIKARQIPYVVLTSNGERELSDGLKRRCAYLYISFPPVEQEAEIIRLKVSGIGDKIAKQIARAVAAIRELDLKKKPSIAETLDWAQAMVLLDADRLDADTVERVLSLLLKDKEDLNLFMQELGPQRLAQLSAQEG